MNKQPPAKGLAISMVPLLALLFNSSIVSAGPENAGGKDARHQIHQAGTVSAKT